MNIRAVVLNDELGAIAYVLKRMGYDVAAIYVKENKSAEICKYNDVAKEVITTDILEVNNADIPYADVVAGQMPYRAARKLRNEIMIESDNRYLNKYKDILLAKRPGFFLFETGKTIMADHYFHAFLSEIKDYGYSVSYEEYDAGKMTGTPVVDSKVYIIGYLNHEKTPLELPEKNNYPSQKLETWTCMGNAGK